jgi:hypothetical protein
MLSFLHVAECDNWHHLLTGDESWFFLNRSPCHMSTPLRDDMITNPRLDIQSKNSCLKAYGIPAAAMLLTDSQMILKWTETIFWQIYSFHLKSRSFLEEERHMRNDWWFTSTITQFT